MKNKLTKEEFKNLYYNKLMNLDELSILTGYSNNGIKAWTKKWNLKLRTRSESSKIRCIKNPNTNPGRKDMPKNPRYGDKNHFYKKGWWIRNGYKRISWMGSEMFEHQYVWCIIHKREIPKGHQIHHINGDKLDNRIENLRCLSNSEHQKLHYKHTILDKNNKFVKKLPTNE